MPSTDVFPMLQSCTKLATSKWTVAISPLLMRSRQALTILPDSTIYDAKFYPFGTIDDDQIFAAVAERDVRTPWPLRRSASMILSLTSKIRLLCVAQSWGPNRHTISCVGFEMKM
jgi:hypothetical protein